MSTSVDILAPAGFVPQQAVSYATADGKAVAVNSTNPLPVAAAETRAATSAPLAGTATSETVAGPFAPQLGREIVLTLSGTFGGSARLLRSIDGGATKIATTVGGTALSWSGPVNEVVWVETEAAATLYLQIAVNSGAISYRVAQ
ncbi:MAG: hypothetical protein ABW184_01090 [Sphingobium sp.]